MSIEVFQDNIFPRHVSDLMNLSYIHESRRYKKPGCR